MALIGAGVALAYADRHLVPASLTGWTVSNISGQVVDAAVPMAGLVLATRRPENRIGWSVSYEEVVSVAFAICVIPGRPPNQLVQE